MELGFGRGREKEARGKETRYYEPFALHAPICWAISGGGDQEQGGDQLALKQVYTKR